jgi:RNA polymerase sigma-70 factor, ECF subfamily
MRTDEELMTAYAAGDDAAFRELFARHAPQLLRRMRHRLPRREDAEELVQQSFLHLHRARGQYQAGRQLAPWLTTIAYNLKREHFRRLMRRPEATLEREPPAPPAREPLERAEEAARLRRALARIPCRQRQVIVMHWFDELDFPSVARQLGVTLSAVKVRASRGYKALRRVLEESELPLAS